MFKAEQITLIGWVAILTTLLGVTFGLLFGWVEFLSAGIVALLLLLTALPFLFAKLPHSVDFFVSTKRVVAGSEIGAHLQIKNTSKRSTLPVSLDLPVQDRIYSFMIGTLAAGETTDKPVVLGPQPRGVVTVGPAQVVRQDPLRIFRREKTHSQKYTVFIHPRTVSLPNLSSGSVKDLEGHASQTISNDDLDFHAVREYVPGDLRRQIHWKATAKTGKLMVKQFEETKRSRLLVLLDTNLNNYRDLEEFELAVSAAASFALRGFAENRQVDIFFNDAGQNSNVRPVTKEKLLDTFSLIRGVADERQLNLGGGLKTLASVASQHIFDASLITLFTGSLQKTREIYLLQEEFRPTQNTSATSLIVVRSNAQAAPSFRTVDGVSFFVICVLDDLRDLAVRAA